jgi:hypothetical protein
MPDQRLDAGAVLAAEAATRPGLEVTAGSIPVITQGHHMPRELRIYAVVTLPEGVFEEAQAIVDAKPILEMISDKFAGAAITHEIIMPKPRGGKTDQAPEQATE